MLQGGEEMISRAHSAQSARAQVNAVIARLPRMSRHKLREWHRKVERILARRPDDSEAIRLLEAIRAERARRPESERRIVTGLIAWEPHAPGRSRFHGWAEGRKVAVIHKLANHGASRRAVYALEIEGERHPSTFDRIDSARAMGERLFAARHGNCLPAPGETAVDQRHLPAAPA